MSPMRGGGATGGNASSSSREGKLPADRSKGKGKQVLPQVAEEEKPDNKPVPPAATKPKRGLLTQKRAQPAPKAFVLEASSDASDGDEDIAMGGTDQVWEEPINTDAFDGDFGIVPEDDDSVIAEEESEVLPAAKKGKQVEGREPAKQKLAPSTKQAKVPPPEKTKPQPKAKANGIGKGKGKAQEDESSPPPKARPAAGGQSKATRKTGKPLLHVDESENDGGDLEEEPSPAQKPKPPVKGKARAVRKTGKPYVPSDEGERDDEELEGEPTPAQKPKPPVKGKAGGMRKTGKPHVPSDEGEGDDGESEEEEEPIPAPKAKAPVRAKGRSKGKLVAEASEEQREEEVKKSSQAPKAKAIPKGRAKAKATEAEVEKEPEPSQQANKKPPPKGRGRAQPKASKAPEPEIPESDRDEQTVAEESEPEVEQPARKRPRKSPKEVASPLPAKASAKSKGKAPAVSKATKKQVAAVRREYSPELQSHVPSPVVRRPAAAKGAPSSSSSRPSQSQKQGKGGQRVIREKPEPTAPEPTAAEGRRSSRQRIKPLEFWKGEKVVYTLGERRKSGAPNAIKMPEIAEIIRVESDQEEKERERERRRKKSASAGAKRKRPVKEEESDYEEEDWETRVVDGEVGVVRGYVKTYPSPQIPGQEMLEEVGMYLFALVHPLLLSSLTKRLGKIELAFSRNRIVTVEVAHSAFTFVKTYTQPYFGTGIIEIPPGGIKKTKNSGKMQLVFYLLAGKVQVQIGETSFRIRKGSQFMVPRGD